MKNLLVSFVFAVFYYQVHAQVPQTDWSKMKLNGKVATLNELVFEKTIDPLDAPDRVPESITEFSFNDKGYLISEVSKTYDSSKLYILLFTYNDLNVLLERSFFYQKGPSTVKTKYKYYADGKLMTEELWFADNLHTNTSYSYNKKGDLVEKHTSFPNSPDQPFTIKYKHDQKGNIIEKYTDQRNVIFPKELFFYDEKGIIIKKSYVKKKGSPEVTVNLEYEWDEKGNWTKMTENPDKKGWPDNNIRVRQIIYY